MAATGAATANLLCPAAEVCSLALDPRALSFECLHSFWHRPGIFLPSSYAAPASFLRPSNSPNGKDLLRLLTFLFQSRFERIDPLRRFGLREGLAECIWFAELLA